MSDLHTPLTHAQPALSVQVVNFAADDPGPGGWERLVSQCRAADEVGIDRIAVADHVVFGEQLEAYGDPASGGLEGGRQPTGPDGHWLEPLTLLSHIAGVTHRVRLSTSILQAALRRPAVLAKMVATVDVLSGGRLDLGVGVGWQREEYEAAGLAFEGRGALLDDALTVCRNLWTEPVSSHSSDRLSFERIHAMPKPIQPGGVPVWVSGRLNSRVMSRIVAHGQGWIPWGADAADPASGLAKIRQALSDAGRDPSGFGVSAGLAVVNDDHGRVDTAATLEPVGAMLEAGLTDFRIRAKIDTDPQRARDELGPLVAGFATAARR